MEKPIIETGVASTIRAAARQIADGAGLGLARGPAGIGKSFALDLVATELAAGGTEVVRVTASPVIGGSAIAFMRAVLAPYRIDVRSTPDAFDAIWELLRGHPFQRFGTRAVFIVDEAQELKTVILETIRSLWDRGTDARLGDEHAPAFGCLFVGNDTFMGKGGNVRTAAFRPLLSRVTHNINLPRPSRTELADFASSLAPESAELQAILRDLGESAGHFRALATAMRVAGGMGDGPIGPDRLRAAIKTMGGAVMAEMLTLNAYLTEERREALQGRFALCTPLSEAELPVFGRAVEELPEIVDALRAELPEASPKVAELLDAAATASTMIRGALRRSFPAGALGAAQTGRVQ
ncbi:ATP-binding protein [Amaricoccus sp.]|uniref:ATP-binding protein n=1 Tax=Amaricoccus sp. TaxID=1872485 RepID=UPI0026354CF9|nr:ATP-binding protein [Amaricoccus sp.]HRO10949.1 ATP-binding protein [Amaricoccus sp.]